MTDAPKIDEDGHLTKRGAGSNIVEVYVHHLRRKFGRETIQTVRGMGYRLSGDV